MQFNYNLQPVDFVGQYMRGKTFRLELEEAKQRKADKEELKRLEEAARREKAMVQDARQLKYRLENGDFSGAQELAISRLQALTDMGADTRDTEAIANKLLQNDYQGALGDINGYLAGMGQLEKAQQTENLTANIKDYLYYQELSRQGKTEEAQMFANKSGLSKLPPQEQAELEAETAGMKEAKKDRIKRMSGYVDSGIDQVDALRDTTRAISLLQDGVKSGRTQDLLLSAKNLFGIEAQDEAEASYLMGVRVLQQLKPIFGSAFTKDEAKMYSGIEAAFDRGNAANNIRLLKRAQEISLGAVKRARRAAKDLGEDFTFQELSDSLKSYENGDFAKGFYDLEDEEKQTRKSGRTVNWADL